MASAHTLPLAIDRALRTGFFRVNDPGPSGTISFHNKGLAVVSVVTVGAESLALPAAPAFGTGTLLLVILKTDGGDLTITGAAAGNVVLNEEGDFGLFIVTETSSSKIWRLVIAT